MEIIEKTTYQGYVWYSDKKQPEIYNGDRVFDELLDANQNPFIVEGQLFNGKKSYSIKYIDGAYIVKCYEMEKMKSIEYTSQSYIANFDKAPGKLKYHQYWRLKRDEYCEDEDDKEGMEVLTPAELVFVGFQKVVTNTKKED